WATSVSVGMPASISRAGAGACTTAPSQARQAYFGRRVTITLNWAGVTSSRSERSSPMTCMAPPQQGQAVLSGSIGFASELRAPQLAQRFPEPRIGVLHARQLDVFRRELRSRRKDKRLQGFDIVRQGL